MTVKITNHKDKSQAELAIAITAAEFAPYLEKAAKKLSKDHPVKGFRPGKITLPVAFESYGKDRVLHEAMDLALPHFFVQAVLDHDIEAIARPSINVTQLSDTDGFAFTATVDVLPEVTIGDLSHIAVTKRTVATTDEEIERELKVLAKMRATPLEVARPAQAGDTVTVDFKVSLNGSILEGGESQNHPVHLGEGHFVPDFEKKLEGISAADEREFTINFPADYNNKELQGKQANVWVKAHAIQKRMLPEINDEFAKKLGKFENLQQLRDALKHNLGQEKTQKEQDRFQAELSEKAAEVSTFGPLPAVLVEREIDNRLAEFSQMLAYQQKTIDDYTKTHNKTLADIREEMRPNAEKAVKIGLTLRALATKEAIKVDDKDVEEKMAAYLQRYATPEAASENVDKGELRDNITSMLRNQKVLVRLEELVKVTTEAIPEKVAEKKK